MVNMESTDEQKQGRENASSSQRSPTHNSAEELQSFQNIAPERTSPTSPSSPVRVHARPIDVNNSHSPSASLPFIKPITPPDSPTEDLPTPVSYSRSDRIRHLRHRGHHLLESRRFHECILTLVLLDLLVILAEVFIELFNYQSCLDHTGSSPYRPSHALKQTEYALHWITVSILSLFVLEIIAKFIVFPLRYFTRHWFHLLDAMAVLISFFTTLFLHGPSEHIVAFFIFLRLWRVFRIVDSVAAGMQLEYANKIETLKEQLMEAQTQLKHTQMKLKVKGDGKGGISTSAELKSPLSDVSSKELRESDTLLPKHGGSGGPQHLHAAYASVDDTPPYTAPIASTQSSRHAYGEEKQPRKESGHGDKKET